MTTHIKRDVQGMIAFLRVVRVARPLLSLFGVEFKKAELDQLLTNLMELSDLAPTFNELFADRAWIAYDWQHQPTARLAIAHAKRGDFNAAEDTLVTAYEPDNVDAGLRQMRNLRCFKKRYELARLAAEDYRAGRLHACVPIVLPCLMGWVKS